MIFYLAARYSRHKELQEYAKDIQSLGRIHMVRSRWIWGNHQIDDKGLSIEAKREERERFAKEDFEDLLHSGVVISFTEKPRSVNSRGGRHVEFGIAIGLGKKCVVIGPRENVFHCLPEIIVYEKWSDYFDYLKSIS